MNTPLQALNAAGEATLPATLSDAHPVFATPSAEAAQSKSAQLRDVTPAERHQMIAEAAYYRAERHGFHGGFDLDNWLEAEAETDKWLLRG